MKLYLAFSTPKISFNDTDIILYNGSFKLPSNCQTISIHKFKPDMHSLSKYYDKVSNHLISEYTDSLIKNIISGSMNNLFTNHLTVFKWITAIETILKDEAISEIIISDIILNSEYVPYYEAEGEVHSQLLYCHYDFIPRLLFDYLSKNTTLSINIHKRRSKFILFFRVFTRRYILFFCKFIFMIYLLTRFKLKNIIKPVNKKMNPFSIILIIRSIAHFDAIRLLIRSRNDICLFCGEGLFTFGKTFNHARRNYTNTAFYLSYLSMIDIFKAFYKICKLLLNYRTAINVHYRDIRYSYTNAMKEISIAYFETVLFEYSLSRFLKEYKKNIKFLITCEMYTPYTKSLAFIGSMNNIKTAQLQSTNMFVMPEAAYTHCDFFIFQTHTLYSSFKKYFSATKEKARFIGNFMLEAPTELTQSDYTMSNRIQNVIYFTQPHTDEDLEQDIIQELIRLSKQFKFMVHIKLHPRDSKNKVAHFQDDICIVDNQLEFETYIIGMDLALLKTSSIAFKIVLQGVPLIYCLLSEWGKKSQLDYINPAYLGNINDVSQIEKHIVNYPTLIESFLMYRSEYVSENKLDNDIVTFNQNFDELLL